MGKAANRKRDRKQAATAATTQANSKPRNGVMDDMLIVMNLMASIELNDLADFQSAVKTLEASGSDLFHFEIKLIDDDEQATEMSLLHYAIYMGAEDILAWILGRGIHAGDEESLNECQAMMEVLNFGGDGTHNVALYQRLIGKAIRPSTVEQAKDMLLAAKTALQQPGIATGCLKLMAEVASEFLSSEGFEPEGHYLAEAATV